MRHRVRINPLQRRSAHRRAMLRNLATSFIKYESIQTTLTKAKVAQPIIEKLISRARENTQHTQRIVAKYIQDKQVQHKLFSTIAPRFSERHGGYTRILKKNIRRGDGAQIALFELVEKTDKKQKETQSTKESKTTKEPKSGKNVTANKDRTPASTPQNTQ